MEKRISLDIGGTFIKCSDGRKVPMSSDGSAQEIAAALKEAIGPLNGLEAIGVCIPGPFDYRKGIFLMKHKFASVYGCSLRELAGIPDGIRIGYVHDVNAPLLGLLTMDASLRKGNVALVTLGTGLGFSYAVDGEIRMDEKLSPAKSLYNLPFREGVLEDYVSRRAILRFYGKPVEGDVKEISDRARAGEKEAIDAFLETGKAFAEGAAPLLRQLGIGTVLFGGQISKSFDLIAPSIRETLPDISIAEVKNFSEAALLGAESAVA